LEEKSPIRQLATNKISHNPVTITKSLGGASVDYVNEKDTLIQRRLCWTLLRLLRRYLLRYLLVGLIRILEEKSPIRQLATNKISHNPVTITKSLGGASVDYVNEKGEFPETNIEFL
jgi:hypothetical protein